MVDSIMNWLKQKKNPLAGKEWVKRAMADHLQDVCKAVEKELRNGR